MKEVPFVWESSFIVSGILPVISLHYSIAENSIIFGSCFTEFSIDVDALIFFLSSFSFCSGVSRSFFFAGASYQFSSFYQVAFRASGCSLFPRVLSMLTEMFLFFNFGTVTTVVLFDCPT